MSNFCTTTCQKLLFFYVKFFSGWSVWVMFPLTQPKIAMFWLTRPKLNRLRSTRPIRPMCRPMKKYTWLCSTHLDWLDRGKMHSTVFESTQMGYHSTIGYRAQPAQLRKQRGLRDPTCSDFTDAAKLSHFQTLETKMTGHNFCYRKRNEMARKAQLDLHAALRLQVLGFDYRFWPTRLTLPIHRHWCNQKRLCFDTCVIKIAYNSTPARPKMPIFWPARSEDPLVRIS